MLNEGPIKYSLQRQRPLGREKPPKPHPLLLLPPWFFIWAEYSQSEWQRISEEHTLSPQWMFNIWFSFLFFCHFHAWAWGFQWKPYGNGREKGEIAPQIHERNTNGCMVNLTGWRIRCWAVRRKRNIRNESKGETKSRYEITTCHSEDRTLSSQTEANVRGLQQSRSCPPVLWGLRTGL